MALQQRHLLLRRVLVRDGPARLALTIPARLQLARVDLVDDAVDVEREPVARGADGARGSDDCRRRPWRAASRRKAERVDASSLP